MKQWFVQILLPYLNKELFNITFKVHFYISEVYMFILWEFFATKSLCHCFQMCNSLLLLHCVILPNLRENIKYESFTFIFCFIFDGILDFFIKKRNICFTGSNYFGRIFHQPKLINILLVLIKVIYQSHHNFWYILSKLNEFLNVYDYGCLCRKAYTLINCSFKFFPIHPPLRL